jgi:hypothetical protein
MSSDKVFSEPTWVIAGEISEVDVAGTQMLRVDVPAVDDDLPGFTKFFGGGAVYAITPTDQLSAMHMAKNL